MRAASPRLVARQLRVTGVVQGVGFRPFVHRLAIRHSLSGWVRNVAGEVRVRIEGDDEEVAAFVAALTAEAPPLARIEQVDIETTPLADLAGFAIAESDDPAGLRQPVSPDVALCPSCEGELFDPADRRYRYPFITCTDCGPRFTVIEAMPYDRERTSMRRFTQCRACDEEYRSPLDRRYHSETNSCPACGPALWFEGGGREVRGSAAPLEAAADLLRSGGILALRGFGGFHLAVDATSSTAVARLRERKRRVAKPFAVMVASLAEAEKLAEVDEEAELFLVSPARPVVVLPARVGSGISGLVAPGMATIGVMLPSTPLHHLLLDLLRPDAVQAGMLVAPRSLVMTSGNLSEEPIAIGNDEARERLAGVADGFLFHDREIVARYDDSVIRPVEHGHVILRRARGLAPLPLRLPVPASVPLLAVGPDLKNTFTLVEGRRASVSQHIGDLDSLEAVAHFQSALARFRELFQIEPQVVVRDRHPGYLSTRLAEELGLQRVLAVQHHHAHIAAVLAEHGEMHGVVGLAFDGTGYGDDGNVWGAEVIHADLHGYRRLAHLRYAPMPGGDRAAREPWRAALGYLSLETSLRRAFAAAFAAVPPRERAMAEVQIARHLNAPLASSMGRLFDAASAVLAVHTGRQFEGQAAMKLEALAGTRAGAAIDIPVLTASDVWQLDPLPLLAAIGERRAKGADPRQLAADFHESVVAAAARIAEASCERVGTRTVALGGGSFQNARLLTGIRAALEERGIRVLVPRELGPNDGAVSFGQAAVAAALLADAQSTTGGG